LTKLLRLGLMGTGFIAETSHMPALKEIPNVEVVAVTGREEEKTKAFAKKWGIGKHFSGDNGIERLCKDQSVDTVLVALPNDIHLDAITNAAENHKNIICEKPLARNAGEARQALDLVRRYGVLHCYGENQLFIPQVVRAMKMIQDGAIGSVTWVRSREAHSGPHAGWFLDMKRAGGGVLLDMGCHSIEVTRKLMGKKPQAVSAWVETLVRKIDADDNSLTLVKFENGGLSQSENSWTAMGGLDLRFEIYGTTGSIFIDLTRETGMKVFTTASKDQTGYIVEKADATQGWAFPVWGEYVTYGFLDQLRHFVNTILSGNKSDETFEDGYLVNRIIDAAYKSSQESRWMDLEE